MPQAMLWFRERFRARGVCSLTLIAARCATLAQRLVA
jgi:hypothetical protein